MCDKCLDIDYRVEDVWRPCYVPPRPKPSYIPTVPRGGGSNEEWENNVQLGSLMTLIRRLQADVAALKAAQTKHIDSRDSFEGVTS